MDGSLVQKLQSFQKHTALRGQFPFLQFRFPFFGNKKKLGVLPAVLEHPVRHRGKIDTGKIKLAECAPQPPPESLLVPQPSEIGRIVQNLRADRFQQKQGLRVADKLALRMAGETVNHIRGQKQRRPDVDVQHRRTAQRRLRNKLAAVGERRNKKEFLIREVLLTLRLEGFGVQNHKRSTPSK